MTFSVQFSSYHQRCLWKSEQFFPCICLNAERLTYEHNVIVIPLDARPTSTLNWQDSINKANQFLEKGLLIVWELCLDHGDGEDDFLLRTNSLAIDHFLQVIWEKFQFHSLGVLGRLETTADCVLFCDYLRSLYAPIFAAEVTLFLLCNSDTRDDFILRRDLLPGFILGVKGKWKRDHPYAFPVLAWDEPQSPLGFFGDNPMQKGTEKSLPLGLLYTTMHAQDFNSMLAHLTEHAFRIIPERLLTQEWEGLNDLVVSAETLSSQGKRKVLGFHAAGGRIITMQKSLNLPNELNIRDFLNGGE